MPYDQRTKDLAVMLYPPFAMLVLDVFNAVEKETGIAMSMVEGRRSFGRQADLYALGRTKPGPDITPEMPLGKVVTKAKAGATIHNYALAVDTCFKKGDGYTEMPWEVYLNHCHEQGLTTLENVKGLNEKNHCEKTWGLQIPDLLSLWQRGGYDLIFNRLDVLRKAEEAGSWKNVLVALKNRLGGNHF